MTTFARLLPVLVLLAFSCLAAVLRAEPPPGGPTPAVRAVDLDHPFRAVWVTRMDYRTRSDVERVIDQVASIGATDVIWQVRGQGDAFYASELEPWGEELFQGLPPGSTTPGFDPLEIAVDRAHARGLLIHAWVNVMPLWKGTTPPKNKNHPYHAHPEWRLYDQAGKPQALHDHYVIVNPTREDVQDHLIAVFKDIVTRYSVDGLHLDYIRFVSEKMDAKSIYPGDPETLAAFTQATGRAGIESPPDRDAFQAWKRDRITDLVRRIRAEVIGARPGIEFSAAVWRRPEVALGTYLQDSPRWVNEGTLDRAIPMIYTDKDEQFAGDIAAWLAAVPDRPISVGLGIYMHSKVEQSPAQLRAAAEASPRVRGFALFAYSSMFDSVDPTHPQTPEAKFERAQRRAAVTAYIRSIAGAIGSGER